MEASTREESLGFSRLNVKWKAALPAASEIEYTGWPQEISLSEYASATAEVVDLVARRSRSASLYQVGGISAPGISDIDFIIVLSDGEPASDLNRWGAAAGSFSPRMRYIIEPKPLIINSQLWNTLPLLHDLIDFRHLSGPVLAPPPSAGPAASISHLFGEIERKLFATQKLERYLLRRSVNVRGALKRLSKIKFDAKALAEFGIEKSTWSEFNDAVSRLRGDWFSLDRRAQTDALYRLIVASPEVTADIILEISGLMVRAGMQLPESTLRGQNVMGAFGYGKVFVRNYRPEFRLECLAGSYLMNGESISVLPATFMLPILIYGSRSPTLGNVFQDRLTLFGEPPDVSHWQLPPGVADRIRVLEQYSDFVREHGYTWALFFNMWGFSKRSAEEYRLYWQEAIGPLAQSADVLPFLLRKRLGQAHPHLARLVGGKATRAYLRLRHAREKLALAGRLRHRAVTWLRELLAKQFGTAERKS